MRTYTPAAVPRPDLDVMRRIWGRVEKVAGCWIYTGPKKKRADRPARPNIDYLGRSVNVRRLVFAANHGDPGHNAIYAKCANDLCMNPDHLTLERPKAHNKEEQGNARAGIEGRELGLERRGQGAQARDVEGEGRSGTDTQDE